MATIVLENPPVLTLDLEDNKITPPHDDEYPEKWDDFMDKMMTFSTSLDGWNDYLTAFKDAVEAAAGNSAAEVRAELLEAFSQVNENAEVLKSALAAANMPTYTEAQHGGVLTATEEGYKVQTPLWRPVDL